MEAVNFTDILDRFVFVLQFYFLTLTSENFGKSILFQNFTFLFIVIYTNMQSFTFSLQQYYDRIRKWYLTHVHLNWNKR
jgi:hypothetical protein